MTFMCQVESNIYVGVKTNYDLISITEILFGQFGKYPTKKPKINIKNIVIVFILTLLKVNKICTFQLP